MHVLATWLLVTALSIPTTTLVLRDGHRIDVDGTVRIENGHATFRAGGALFTIPESEVDIDATKAAAIPAITVRGDEPKRLKVSEEERRRLLHDLEARHDGRPAPTEQTTVPAVQTKSRAEKAAESSEEWTWRGRARNYEEGVRQAQENLDLLRSQAEELRAKIRNFITIGYETDRFSYESTRLASVLEQIPYAEQDVQRAQRLYDQFRDDARRQGILPGWLR
ncbi:MAG: hypothetical protein JWO97_1031 [Acidobacteria bacterium]|nr:hypothetical protein [Acidobacteriota bacterium]